MKKTLILAVASILVLAGCGQGGNNQEMEGVPQQGEGQQQMPSQQQAPSQPQGQGQQQAPSQPQGQGQQGVSLNDQAESALSEGEMLMEQYGEVLSDDEKDELESSLGDLEDLSKQDDIDPEELQTAIREIQEDIQPISEAVQEQSQQGSGSQQQQLPE